MATTSTIKSIRCSMKLNNGSSETGKIKTVSVSLGNLKTNAWDNDKAMAIIEKVAPCLSKTLYTTEKTEVDTLASA